MTQPHLLCARCFFYFPANDTKTLMVSLSCGHYIETSEAFNFGNKGVVTCPICHTASKGYKIGCVANMTKIEIKKVEANIPDIDHLKFIAHDTVAQHIPKLSAMHEKVLSMHAKWPRKNFNYRTRTHAIANVPIQKKK